MSAFCVLVIVLTCVNLFNSYDDIRYYRCQPQFIDYEIQRLNNLLKITQKLDDRSGFQLNVFREVTKLKHLPSPDQIFYFGMYVMLEWGVGNETI